MTSTTKKSKPAKTTPAKTTSAKTIKAKIVPMHMFDLVLRGGRVIDPANGIDGIRDVGIRDGKIAAVAPSIPRDRAAKVVNVAGKLVLPGLIDTHCHINEHISHPFGISPELTGVRSGATVGVDLGSASAFTFQAFRKLVAEPAATRVYSFVSIFLAGGLFSNFHADLLGPSGINTEVTAAMIKAHPDMIRGIKVQVEAGTYSRGAMYPLEAAKKVGRETGVPVYVHLGRLFPLAEGAVERQANEIVAEAMQLLDPGDIIAHPFRRNTGCFVSAQGAVYPAILEALKRGVRVDVGRGLKYNYDTARIVLDSGIVPDTLGMDVHGLIVNPDQRTMNHGDILGLGVNKYDTTYGGAMPKGKGKPTYVSASIAHGMTELLALGLTIDQVIPMVTTHGAEMIGLLGKHGTLGVGRAADVTVMDLEQGNWTLRDPRGLEATTTQRFIPDFVLVGGVRYESDVRVPEGYQTPNHEEADVEMRLAV